MADQTKEELEAEIKALQRQLANLKGDGAIAQGDKAVAAGKGGLAVGGDIHGNVYLGKPTDDPEAALRIYRQVLVASVRHLPLRGIDIGAGDAGAESGRMGLAGVYVDLDTRAARQRREPVKPRAKEDDEEFEFDLDFDLDDDKDKPVSALQTTAENRRLVLLGDPGSGKSTFLNHLSLCLAAHCLKPEAGWLDRLRGWPETDGDLIPIPVVLRDYARALPSPLPKAEPAHLWRFIAGRLKSQNLVFVAKPLKEALQNGKALVLLDGLDEIPTAAQRTFVRDAVAVFAGRYPKSRFVVTCRVLSYQNPKWQLADWPGAELAPFDEDKIDRFVEAWYGDLAGIGQMQSPEEAKRFAERLKIAVRRTDLRELAPNPLLLTVMALVHTHKGRLPEARALLYEECIDILP